MAAISAGLLMYRRTAGKLSVLLVHPGGPFWKNKDSGAWSIPKGEIGEGEDPLAAAIREFQEELGTRPVGDFASLGEVVQRAGKRVVAFAVEGGPRCHGDRKQFLRARVAAAKRPRRPFSGGRPRRLVLPGTRTRQDSRRPAAVPRPTGGSASA